MKKGFNIFILIFGLIAFASCSKEKDLPGPDQSMVLPSQDLMSIRVPMDQPKDTTVHGLYIDKKTSNTKKINLNGSSNFVKAP